MRTLVSILALVLVANPSSTPARAQTRSLDSAYGGESSVPTRPDASEYFRESERQRQLRIKAVWLSDLPRHEKQTAIKELRSKPYYAMMNVDISPTVGQVGVLPPEVTATVIEVADEFNMVVNISWYNERFQAHYGRKVWIQGFATSAFALDAKMPLRGVLRVSGTKTASDGSVVPLLEVVDLSRFMEEAFAEVKYAERANGPSQLHAEMELRDTQEATAQDWLRSARWHLSEGYGVWGRNRLQRILNDYPNTDAAKDAKELLTHPGRREDSQVAAPTDTRSTSANPAVGQQR